MLKSCQKFFRKYGAVLRESQVFYSAVLGISWNISETDSGFSSAEKDVKYFCLALHRSRCGRSHRTWFQRQLGCQAVYWAEGLRLWKDDNI